MCVCVCVRVCVCVCVCVCACAFYIASFTVAMALVCSTVLLRYKTHSSWHVYIRTAPLEQVQRKFHLLSKLNQDCCEHHFQVHFFKAHCSLPFQFVLILFCSSPASSFERWIQLRCQRKFVRIQHSLFSNEQSEHGSVRKRQREHWQEGDCKFWCCKKSKTQKAQMREVS